MVAYDSTSKRAVLIGGAVEGSNVSKDVWILEHADGAAASRWVLAANEGPDFGGNNKSGFGCTTDLGKCVLALGSTGPGYRNDVWTVQIR